MANTYLNTDWSADALTKATATSSTVDNVALGGTLAVTGVISPTTHIDMPDSANIKLGTGDDLQLYHDGSNSYITNSTGALKLATESSGIAVTIGHTTSEVTIGDNLTVTGTLTLGSGAELTEAELEMLDGITAGTAAASKALVLDSNKDIGTIRNLTIDGTFSDGNYTFDTSGNVTGLGNVTMTGDLTVSGGDINLEGEASTITLIDNTINALQIGAAGAAAMVSINTTNDDEFVNFQHAHASTSHSLRITSAVTLTGSDTFAGAGGIRFDPAFIGNYTITNYSYLLFDNIQLVSSAAITNASIVRFNANAGTHIAVDSGTTHPDIDATDAWIKIDINGTVHYIPAYTDKS